MRIEKSCDLPFPRETVWTALLNAELVGACVPGVERVERLDDDRFLVTVTIKLGVIKPTFRLNINLLEQSPPSYVRSSCAGEANGMMGSLRQKTEVRLADGGSGTRMDVQSEIDVFGRLGTFGYGVFKGKADQLWDQFVANFLGALTSGVADAQG